MSTVQKLALTLVLLSTGLLAGLQTLMLMGVLPAMARVPLLTYAVTWRALDHFMSGRMPILANATLLLYLISIGIFARFRPRWILWSLLGAFALLAMDTVSRSPSSCRSTAQFRRLMLPTLQMRQSSRA